MTLYHMIVVALVQGITEFLPISSSGHLILIPALTGFEDQGLIIDVAVHVGTLFAVCAYFWRDVLTMTLGLWDVMRFRFSARSRLLGLVTLATIPVVIVGFLLSHYKLTGALRSAEVIAYATIGFGIVLYIADKIGLMVRKVEHVTVGDTILMGLAQCLALIPGTSRSGITMTAARVLGYERGEAARFSMLMSIPTIIAAATLTMKDLLDSGNVALEYDALITCVLSFFAALLTISILMRWLERATFTPFVLYRIVLGIGLLAYIYW